MADQTARQRARRTALDARARMRERRAEQERRLDALGLVVVSALAERDVVAAACEARAGAALAKMTEQERLSLAQAVEWCGGADLLTVREAARLRQAAQKAGVAEPVWGTPKTSVGAGADGAAGAVAGGGGADGGRAAG